MRERLKLAAERIDGPSAARPSAQRMLREASYPLSPLTRRIRRAPKVTQTNNPKNVLLLPGFLAGPQNMAYLGEQLRLAGHEVTHWSLGFNTGPTPAKLECLEKELRTLFEAKGQEVTLIGWSLGGLFARELAKRHSQASAKVITLGSPFSGDPRANNAWRLYQLVAGHRVDEPPVESALSEKPPVETVAFWSPRDGVVAPRSARGKPGERDRVVTARCTHMGFSYSPDAIEAILQELERS
ncbi:alpha/beta hydrolase [Altererythrobacter lutimaris]|uniref:alpha/beta hydrolase n=1 Tax=Altererythrobacter lutimaris TaxID=2743979 RepID=UPI001E3E43A2|nr:alpha/beta hydrolase [Altererythrobacter lutimaris]